MNIQHKTSDTKGSFFIDQDGILLAEMTYVWAGDKMIIDHTEVSQTLAGKGIGKQLVSKAVEYAHEKHVKILPLCPFAKSVFEKVEEFRDVLI